MPSLNGTNHFGQDFLPARLLDRPGLLAIAGHVGKNARGVVAHLKTQSINFFALLQLIFCLPQFHLNWTREERRIPRRIRPSSDVFEGRELRRRFRAGPSYFVTNPAYREIYPCTEKQKQILVTPMYIYTNFHYTKMCSSNLLSK